MNYWALFYGAAAIQGYFISIALFTVKKGNRNANKILAALVILLSIYITDIALGQLGFFNEHPHFLHITTPLWYLFAPLSYFYIRLQLGEKLSWKWYYILHLIPFAIFLYRIFPFYFLSGELKLKFFTGELKFVEIEVLAFIIIFLSPVQIFSYTIIILKHIFKKETTEKLQQAHLSWLKLFFSLMMVYATAQIFFRIVYTISGEILVRAIYFPLALFTFIIYAIAYLVIVRPERIISLNVFKLRSINLNNSPAIADSLNKLMLEEKPYLNSSLKYSEIAHKLGISTRLLTEVLKKEMGVSFNDYINSFRINEVQDRIASKKHEQFTLLSIALDSGFSSKSSFNRVFKKQTGLTPTEYINQNSMIVSQKVS